ncbi:MAG: hypothetical protein IAF58_07655 [Leptolyngbya sp.]|nr:hypothetical protein [Candidatus Melainabacteria bacterium]
MKTKLFSAALIIAALTTTFGFPISSKSANSTKAAQSPSPRAYPRLVGRATTADAKLALTAAQAAFNSKAWHLYDPEAADVVRAKTKALIAWPEAENVAVDPKFLESKTGGEAIKASFLQIKAVDGNRFALRQKPMNWQGDWFDVYLVNSRDDTTKIFDTLSLEDLYSKSLPGYKMVSCDAWQKPWLLRNVKNEHVLFIDTGHPAEYLCEWIVTVPSKTGSPSELCKIQFCPRSEKIVRLVPQGALRNLAVLLDKIIGIPKESEGSTQATPRLRLSVAHTWGNVLYRPWAVAEPSLSRIEVDALLKTWSRGSKIYAAQYAQIKPTYESAKLQLANYYEHNFGKSKREAQAMSSKILDRTYRTHFSPWSG